MKNKIAIYGGTFSPLHIEHVRMVEETLRELKPQKLIIVPTQNPPHKSNSEIMPKDDRLNMLTEVFNSYDNVEISTFELEKKTVCYTFELLEHFKREFPDSELFYILGEDSLNDFKLWKNPKQICKLSKLYVFRRQNSGIKTQALIKKSKLVYGAKIKLASYIGKEISSTDTFVMYQFGDNLSSVLPKQVVDYIEKNNLFPNYRELVEFVKSNITPKRFKHTYNVCLYAMDLAKRLKFNREKVFIASVLHDVGKYKDIDYAETVGIERSFLQSCPQSVWHQYISSHMAKECLKIADDDILNAIMYHSTGRVGMSLLEKIVYVADYCEKGRQFTGVEKAREEVKKDFKNGFCFCLEQNIQFIKQSGESLCELSLEALKYEKERLKEN